MLPPSLRTDIDELREWIAYDPETGLFTWRKAPVSRISPGDVAGSTNHHGYWRVKFRYVGYMGHRMAWALHYGEWPELMLDHINGDKLDNRIVNLRQATHAQNQQNRHHGYGRSGLLGVSWVPKGRKHWRASIQANGRWHQIGNFLTEEEAHDAYMATKAEVHPFTAA